MTRLSINLSPSRNVAIWALLFLLGPSASGQVRDESYGTSPREEDATRVPVMIGGMESLQSSVIYPEEARRLNIEGTVVVQFIVDESGSVAEPAAVGYPSQLLAQEAIRAVRRQRFVPGLKGGVPAPFQFAVPVTFRFDGVSTPTPVPSGLIGGLRAIEDSVVYPDAARAAGIGGNVYVRFTVETNGQIADVHVVDTPSALLSEAAIDAIRRQHFLPRRRGRSVQYTVAVPFRLADGASGQPD